MGVGADGEDGGGASGGEGGGGGARLEERGGGGRRGDEGLTGWVKMAWVDQMLGAACRG